ncbi:HigA family addiction module antitoxin [endosymbiont GvMRE of Glomus versiforme]|uniref:HigA family addiction module antitoxin n=1 Tax=endosymbiont GvMRE of Glomus versiforme TaxID=2039283 RepID=UPI000EE4096A|nr:HigA family addiction module antitoxin [endosymbiont GvMRE of Glomus versiforme]RHZ36072.1 Addiction module antidote protein, HigA family [endosymbiont GvMRE of Glomus versiforme]
MKTTNKQEKFVVKPIHPGTILREEILIPRDISPQELADALQVSKEQIKWVCEERADITPDLAARLAFYFGSSVELWLNLQLSYEEELAKAKMETIKKQITPYKAKPESLKHAPTR